MRKIPTRSKWNSVIGYSIALQIPSKYIYSHRSQISYPSFIATPTRLRQHNYGIESPLPPFPVGVGVPGADLSKSPNLVSKCPCIPLAILIFSSNFDSPAPGEVSLLTATGTGGASESCSNVSFAVIDFR